MQGEQLAFGRAELLDLHPSTRGAAMVEARAEIGRLWAAGYTTAAVTRSLNARGYPTPTGRGQWHPGTVRRTGDPRAAQAWRSYMRRYREARR